MRQMPRERTIFAMTTRNIRCSVTDAHPRELVARAPDSTDAQLRDELTLAYTDLGAATFALAHHGSLNEHRLAVRLQRIHDLTAQLAARERARRTAI
jgi:hypothetical protein